MHLTHPIENDTCSDERTGQALLPVDLALDLGLDLVEPVDGLESLPLGKAVGRVLASDLLTPMDLPPFDNSGMDGYALRSCDTNSGRRTKLRVAARIAAGDNKSLVADLGPGEACRIFTGAALPRGADAVIMQEHVTRAGEFIVLSEVVKPGQNIRRQGEDAPANSLLLKGGTFLGPRELGAIASIGHAKVTVRRKIRVALLCTGSELKEPGEPLAPGQIYNSNRYMMMAALADPHIELIEVEAIKDDPASLGQALKKAASKADIIISTGGVSVGEEDHVIAQINAIGGQVAVMKIAMKPGKPLSLGTIGSTLFIGLPGNPVAAFTTWRIFGVRLAKKMSGVRQSPRALPQVVVAQDITRRPGRQEYRPARIVGKSDEGHPMVQLLDKTFSAKLSLICRADGFAVIPAGRARLSKGERLDFVYL